MQEQERDEFYQMLFRTYYEWKYYEAYRTHLQKRNTCLTIAIAIFSCGGISALCNFSSFQIVIALFIAAMQIIQAILPHLNHSQRIDQLKYVTQEYNHTYRKMEYDWMKIRSNSDSDIRALLYTYKREVDEITDRFLDGDTLKPKNALLAYAENLAKQEFSYNYNSEFEKVSANE